MTQYYESLEPEQVSVTVKVNSIGYAGKAKSKLNCHLMDGKLNDRTRLFSVIVPKKLCSADSLRAGAIYDVTGDLIYRRQDVGKITIRIAQVTAKTLKMIRPSGRQIIDWIMSNVQGIGQVKADKLYDKHGTELLKILDSCELEELSDILPNPEIRNALSEAWLDFGDTASMHFINEINMPLDLASKALKFHGKNFINAIKSDPYRLLSFTGSWSNVDTLAQEKLSIELSDQRRIAAAIEESIYRAFDDGHTCSTLDEIKKHFTKLTQLETTDEHFKIGLNQGLEVGQFVKNTVNGLDIYHSPGAFILEREAADFIKSLNKPFTTQKPLIGTDIETLLNDFEVSEAKLLGIESFKLNKAQREAVKTSFSARFSIITGGAGVGKTTVLKALYKALDTLGKPRFQMALSGRAAARMSEATGERSFTIAAFLRNVKDEMGQTPVIIIDEASMLDLSTFTKLAKKLPTGTHLILVGDPYQLPPIGAGLVFHKLCDSALVAKSELTEVKRQGKDSKIPAAAQSIRNGRTPEFEGDSETAEVIFIDALDKEIIPKTLELYERDRDSTQILSATNACNFAGVNTLNHTAHSRYTPNGKPLKVANEETGWEELSGFREGDLLLYTANLWDRSLQNGCLGKLEEVFDTPRMWNVGSDEEPIYREALAIATFEGEIHPIFHDDIDNLEHAFAITVHKAQGSQFDRVIIPIRNSRVLDRTFVYTALTRAKKQVIFVGDRSACINAIANPPKAFSRRVALGEMIADTTIQTKPDVNKWFKKDGLRFNIKHTQKNQTFTLAVHSESDVLSVQATYSGKPYFLFTHAEKGADKRCAHVFSELDEISSRIRYEVIDDILSIRDHYNNEFTVKSELSRGFHEHFESFLLSEMRSSIAV